MDPELRKMLIAAHAAGASDDDLGKLIDKWDADHAPSGAFAGQPSAAEIMARPDVAAPHDAGLQAQADAAQQRATLRGMVPMPTYAQVGQNIAHFPQRIARQAGLEAVNAVQGIPGGKGVLAKVRSVGRSEPYAQAYQDVGALTNELPQRDQTLGRLVGGAALLPVLPANPAVAGAVLGGADQALSGQPGLSATRRAVNTGLGTLAGGITGSLVGNIGTAARSSAAPSVGAARLDQAAKMAEQDAANYGNALHSAAPREPTPAITALFNDPHFEAIASALEKQPQFAGMDRTDPAFLDQMYKSLSDKGVALEKGLAQFDPTQPNTKRAQQQAVKLLKGKLLAAMEAPGEKPPITFDVPAETHRVEPVVTELGHEQAFGHPMSGTANQYAASPTTHAQLLRDFPSVPQRQGPAGPGFNLRANPGHVQPGVDISAPAMRVQTAPGVPLSPYMPEYRTAVEQHAENVRLGKAFERGYSALQTNASPKGVPLKQATKLSPEAIDQFMQGASPAERQRFTQGVLARLQQEPKRAKLVFPSRALRTATDLTRMAHTPSQTWADFLSTLGLTSANAAGGPP